MEVHFLAGAPLHFASENSEVTLNQSPQISGT